MNLSWLGGLFDGEGSVATRLRPPSAMVVQLSVNMTDLGTINEVDSILQSNNIKTSRTIARTVNRKPYHMLMVCDHLSVIRCCDMLVPVTLTKKAELIAGAVALHEYRSLRRNERAEQVPAIYERMRMNINTNRMAS